MSADLSGVVLCGVANKRIIEPACGDHPTFLLAEKGDVLEVIETNQSGYDYSVVNYLLSPNPFGVDHSEIEFDSLTVN